MFKNIKCLKMHQTNTILNCRCSDGCFYRGTCVLHMSMVEFKWMLPQRDLWITHEHGGIQMDASTEGHVVAHEQLF